MVNRQKMTEIMAELGHTDNVIGTEYLQIAVGLYRRGMSMTKELYPAIAFAVESTPSRVERCMRHSIGKAWGRGDYHAQLRYFGSSVNPNTGVPTVGEYVARMATLCHEA